MRGGGFLSLIAVNPERLDANFGEMTSGARLGAWRIPSAAILTASTAIQLAEEREKDGHGVFTKALIDCLREGGKEIITVNDWYEFAYRQLKALANQTPLKWGLEEQGPSFEIGNFRAKHERERVRLERESRLEQERLERERLLEQERLERERQRERERLERERQQERERLISTARARLGAYLALGELTEQQVEEAVALLKRDEARLFPRDRKYRDDLIRFSKGEASFLEVFGAGHILRPEPAPKPPEDEVSPAITPPEAPPTAVDQLVTTPEPPVVDGPVPAPRPPEGSSFESGNFRPKHERERQREREQLIATARTKFRPFVAAGDLTDEEAESFVRLAGDDETRLLRHERMFRHDVIRFVKGEATYREVFGTGHVLRVETPPPRPEPPPKPPKDEVHRPVPPREPPVVDPPITPSKPAAHPTVNPPVTPPEPPIIDVIIHALLSRVSPGGSAKSFDGLKDGLERTWARQASSTQPSHRLRLCGE